jgi:hypothetical protein
MVTPWSLPFIDGKSTFCKWRKDEGEGVGRSRQALPSKMTNVGLFSLLF